MIDNGPKYYLRIDANARTLNRYERRPGKWGVRRLECAKIPEESVGQLGNMAYVLARFRMTGKPE